MERPIIMLNTDNMPVFCRNQCANTKCAKHISKAYECGGVIHCYSYSPEMAEEYVKMGFFNGMGGVLTFKNAKKLVRCAERIPLSSIVLETDCPYMAPEPNRGKRNDSSQLIYVAQKLAEIKGITAEEVKQATTENAHRLYRLTQNK